MPFTQEDLAALASLIGATVDERLKTLVTPTVPTAPALAIPSPVALVVPTEKKERKAPTPAQLAADAADPLCNEYTPLVRFGHDYERYAAIWTKLRDQFKASGNLGGYASPGKAAQALYGARLKLERTRLAERDKLTGLTATRIPTVDPSRIHSNMPAADPTANAAVRNVLKDERDERIAQLQAEIVDLKQTLDFEFGTTADPKPYSNPLVELASAIRPRERSAASVAQAAIGANPTQRTLDKLVRDAKASGKPAEFVLNWLKGATETTRKRRQGMARQALQLLGVQISK